MRERLWLYGMIPLTTLACLAFGCVNAARPLDLTSLDPATDQRKIADYHRQDAVFFRLKARELAERMVAYHGLFGADSEWVNGARLLAQFYEDAAIDQDHQALMHLSIADDTRALSFDRRSTLRHNGQLK